MITLQSEKMRLEEVGTVYSQKDFECVICRDAGVDGEVFYTVLRVTNHELVRDLLSLYESADLKNDVLLESASAEGAHVFVYPYAQERPLSEFYMPDTLTLSECEDICINVIMACMTSGLPWPLLYLVLDQNLIHLNKDGSVYFSYTMDLTGVDINIRERDCATRCAMVLMELLEDKSSQKAISYTLLKKKTENRSYNKLTELYQDIRIAAAPKSKGGILYRIRRWFSARSDLLFGILFWVSLILAIIALVMLLTNMVFGDIPWLRLFINNFERIGTESLKQ